MKATRVIESGTDFESYIEEWKINKDHSDDSNQ